MKLSLPSALRLRLFIPWFKRAVSGFLALSMMVQATGCTSTQTVPPPWPGVVQPGASAKKIDVELVDGRTFKADSARVAADTMVLYRPQRVDTLLVPEVKSIQSSHVSIGKTLALFLGALVALVVAGVASCSDTLC